MNPYSDQALGEHFSHILAQLHEIGTMVIPILQMRKLRIREDTFLLGD